MPRFPLELEHIWTWFLSLSRARQVGMAANPITFSDIEAFNRLTHAGMSAWEVGVLRRVDDAVMAVRAGQKPSSRPTEPEAIPASEPSRLKAMFRGLAARSTPKT